MDDRLAILRQYLLQLGRDLAAQGKFRAEGGDRLEAYALAAIQGTGAVASQLWADLKALAPGGIAVAGSVVEGALLDVAARGLHAIVERGADAVTSRLDGRAERRRVGKDLMESAANLGKRDRRGRP